MIRSSKIVLSASAAALSIGAFAAPASAAPNSIAQEGLVNLAVTGTTIQVPIGVAANVCGISVNLLTGTGVTGPVDCEALADTTAQRADNGGPNNTRQEGLVNLAITDTTVQLPVAIAANVCGVAVNVLAGPTGTSPVNCTVRGVALADA